MHQHTSYSNAVQKHTVNEENSSEIPWQYSCVKCKKYYDNKKSLQSHIRLENEQKQIIKCEKCNKELKSSLERHTNKVFCGSGESYLLVDRKIKNKFSTVFRDFLPNSVLCLRNYYSIFLK